MKTTTTRKFTKIMAAVLAAAAITFSAGAKSVCADTYETAEDSQLLNYRRVCPDRWGQVYTIWNWEKVSNTVDESWRKVGVQCVSDYFHDNKYYINGKEVSRSKAYIHMILQVDKSVIYIV